MAETSQKAGRLQEPRCPQGPGVAVRWELLARPARTKRQRLSFGASELERGIYGRCQAGARGRMGWCQEDGEEGEGAVGLLRQWEGCSR